ncbi:hypothetical protein ACSBDS_002167 [Staphylococcus pseudintermedius]|uniref:hypothetical protein n=1 Tax=Staphylococcus pseudintermedius TaxID=283734 RepID=UPI0019EFDCBA|nr:hypothetical protein [Staphylococcus pseudintermedius]EGQ0325903.1 hypothetical protein [Staphylococcus pseudintermedius]EGQ1586124.1 hypothetical protein [Staphylococcus pseudintermedius]EGQ2884511.1 hypothetical protein [Staphylococcus pseudintermedius]EGQ3886475.1 hypothetical protein [Staphylococcus pseudintermedius]EHL7175042.1 hypothetical protein [Staphylococcus pseudintermedius]
MANVTTEQVIKYINNMPTTEYYKSLDENIVNQHIFAAQEEVNDLLINYPKITLSARMVALQALYNIEAEEEGFGMLRRQGVKNYSVKDVSVSFDDNISPRLLELIRRLDESTKSNTARVGRLI